MKYKIWLAFAITSIAAFIVSLAVASLGIDYGQSAVLCGCIASACVGGFFGALHECKRGSAYGINIALYISLGAFAAILAVYAATVLCEPASSMFDFRSVRAFLPALFALPLWVGIGIVNTIWLAVRYTRNSRKS